MGADILTGYGMRAIATVRIADDSFQIDVFDNAARDLTCAIYAFLVDNEIVRIGSSKGSLGKRMRAWELDVSAALQGRAWRTPKAEADGWRERLPSGVIGSVWAREGTLVDTPAGTINTYLAEESALIGRHLPALNNSKHR